MFQRLLRTGGMAVLEWPRSGCANAEGRPTTGACLNLNFDLDLDHSKYSTLLLSAVRVGSSDMSIVPNHASEGLGACLGSTLPERF